MRESFPFLDDDEYQHFIDQAVKLNMNHSPAYLQTFGTPWSVDQDVLIYIDEVGADSAYADGAEIVINKFANEDEKSRLNKTGYVATEAGVILAYGRFLMERFVMSVVQQKAQKAKDEDFTKFLKGITDGTLGKEEIDGDSEDVTNPRLGVEDDPDESAEDFVKRIEEETAQEIADGKPLDPHLDSPTTDEDRPNQRRIFAMTEKQAALGQFDERDPKGGWMPGFYFGMTCHKCSHTFSGHKRAIECAPCAYGDKDEKEETNPC